MLDKKELKKQYKQNLPPMGIFKVTNHANGKILLGRSSNLKGKENSLQFQLEMGACTNIQLQEDYKKFGKDNFSFEIVDILEAKDDPAYDYREELKVLEEMWLEKLQPVGEKGYNKAI